MLIVPNIVEVAVFLVTIELVNWLGFLCQRIIIVRKLKIIAVMPSPLSDAK